MNSQEKTEAIFCIETLLEKENLACTYLCLQAPVMQAISVAYNTDEPEVQIQKILLKFADDSVLFMDCPYVCMLCPEDEAHAKYKELDKQGLGFSIEGRMYRDIRNSWERYGLTGVIAYAYEAEYAKNLSDYYDLSSDIKRAFLEDLLKKVLTVQTV